MGEPRYLGTKTGDIIQAIVLNSRHTWKEIQDKTGFTEKELNYNLHLLFNDNVIFREKNQYLIIPELETEYINHFQQPTKQPATPQIQTKVIKQFSVSNIKGIILIAALILSIGLNISNSITIYQLENQIEEYAPFVQSYDSNIAALETENQLLEAQIAELQAALEEQTSPTTPSSSTSRIITVEKIATVSRVIDGDTFELSNGDRIRLADIDAPESDELGYSTSTNALSSWILGETVYLDVSVSLDPYGRYVCVVYIEHNSGYTNINNALVVGGYADLDDYPNEFDPSEWGTPGTLSTSSAEYITSSSSSSSSSSSTSTSSTGIYVGSKNSNKYHLPSCYWAQQINPSNEIWFTSKADAAAHGYVPCKVCNP